MEAKCKIFSPQLQEFEMGELEIKCEDGLLQIKRLKDGKIVRYERDVTIKLLGTIVSQAEQCYDEIVCVP